MNSKKYLAIDYGTVRVGIALGVAGFAEPLTVIPNNSGLFDALLHLIATQKPDVVVVGISEKEMAEQSRQFAEALQAYLQGKDDEPSDEHDAFVLPEFAFADETLSSVEVQQKLREAGHRNLRNGPIDHYAAAQFLQEFLDLHQSEESQ
jgi:putative transcription antitermination factor YqgF